MFPQEPLLSTGDDEDNQGARGLDPRIQVFILED
jgi:hypothetical protein